MNSNDYIKPGRPETHTDAELRELAVNIKYKCKGKKITPTLLEKETGIGRNTWSRRIKSFIEELNNPVLRSIPLDESIEVFMPNIEMIFEKYGNNKERLNRELYSLEELIDTLYFELKNSKEENKKLMKYQAEAIKYKHQAKEQLQRANYYEDLYNKTVASSLYPHLFSKSPILREFNINEKLVNIKEDTDNQMTFKKIALEIDGKIGSNENLTLSDIKKKERVMEFLKDEFDL
ncbi:MULTISPECIES: hypothetical protein [unclassified Lysinibacillus]|uniref:hypothetical protein n=1 Tax=unclassified Lysinibacillus TaxID=2636778 RepID=UPI0008901C3F|nr:MULTISPECIES: hypothetical protein [unclassified Lysinibacillus]SCY51912.1 hypothetical protein SAMN02787078_01691 [Lysinibacillus sp. SG9]SDB22655.1 hypothetical protein SAMN02787079_01693 [Lysinibacillus sp. TC-37]SFS71858.1 hypothetical protein SAMN02787087_01655 [Lysinibacillus sp. SG55]